MAKKIIILLLLFPLLSMGQKDVLKGLELPVKGVYVRTTIYEGDTIPYVVLPAINCYTDRIFTSEAQRAAWTRIKYNVKKVYPYAILAAAKLKEYDRTLATIPEGQRAAYAKKTEQELKNQFEAELKGLSQNQGRILIKLIDRETGKTTYDVVKDVRGSFSAFMWQGLALLNNTSLKSEYDPDGDDKAVEEAIKLVENGDF